MQVIEGQQRLRIVGDLLEESLIGIDRALGQAELLLVHLGDAQAQRARLAPVGTWRGGLGRGRVRRRGAGCHLLDQLGLVLQALDDVGPQADPRVQPRQRLERTQLLLQQRRHVGLGLLGGRVLDQRDFHVRAALFLRLGLVDEPLQRVDGLVRLLEASLVQIGQLAELGAPLGPGRQRVVGRAGPPLEQVAEILPALLTAIDLLHPVEGGDVVGLEAEDRRVELLGLVQLPERVAEARDVVVQRHRRLDRAELVDRAEVDVRDAIPLVVLAADALQLAAHGDVGRLDVERALQRAKRLADVVLPLLPDLRDLQQVAVAGLLVVDGQRFVGLGQLLPGRLERDAEPGPATAGGRRRRRQRGGRRGERGRGRRAGRR